MKVNNKYLFEIINQLKNLFVSKSGKIIYDSFTQAKASDLLIEYATESRAFECMGILGNEATLEPFESRLEIVEEMIKEYLDRRD